MRNDAKISPGENKESYEDFLDDYKGQSECRFCALFLHCTYSSLRQVVGCYEAHSAVLSTGGGFSAQIKVQVIFIIQLKARLLAKLFTQVKANKKACEMDWARGTQR